MLGIIDPPDCDERGVPLDWDRCRTCGGLGVRSDVPGFEGGCGLCPRCGGHGSLKAAALAAKTIVASGESGYFPAIYNARCEDCGHPMSMNEGTWEPRLGPAGQAHMIEAAMVCLRVGAEPEPFNGFAVHFSPCDEGCRHGGPGRVELRGGGATVDERLGRLPYEASWRPVDVCTGQPAPPDHPHPMIYTRPWDLRQENLSVLCLRCWVLRGQSS